MFYKVYTVISNIIFLNTHAVKFVKAARGYFGYLITKRFEYDQHDNIYSSELRCTVNHCYYY